MRRRGNLAAIGEIIERNIFLKGADALTQKGFTMVPNHVLVSGKISPGAKLCFAMLLRYAWQSASCFPGQERLALDMGVSDRSVRTYLQELSAQNLITIRQRGLGKSNLYEINLVPSGMDRKIFPVRTGNHLRSRSAVTSD